MKRARLFLIVFILLAAACQTPQIPTSMASTSKAPILRSLTSTPMLVSPSLTPSFTAIPSSLPVAPAAGWWLPPVATTWQWDLDDPPVDQSFDVDMYDIDLFDNDASVAAALHAAGRKVVCYISVGSWEDWRPDKEQFPVAVIGKDYEGWEWEKWLDIRQIDLLAPIIRARFDQCKAKGLDAIEPDNMDGYTNNTSFPLKYAFAKHLYGET